MKTVLITGCKSTKKTKEKASHSIIEKRSGSDPKYLHSLLYTPTALLTRICQSSSPPNRPSIIQLAGAHIKSIENGAKPQITLIKRADGAPLGRGVPSYSVMPAQLVVPSDEVTDPRIVISDFGEAWLSNNETRNELHSPVLSRPPETIFSRMSVGSPADVWTLGCTLYEGLGERPLFEGFMPDTDDTIAEMISCQGLTPDQWWQSWQAKDEFFREDGSWKTDTKRSREPKSRPLLLRIEQM